MLKKILISMGIVAVVALFLFSCSSDSGGPKLAGTWTISTAPDGGTTDFGSGTFTVSFFTTVSMSGQTFHLYIGSGSLNPGTFEVSVVENESTSTDNITITFEDPADENNSIDFYGTLNDSRNSASGDYDGWGIYISDYGTFTATKQ